MDSVVNGTDVEQVRDRIQRSWIDLRRHDQEKFLNAYASDCSVLLGETRVSGRERLRQLFSWYGATYTDCSDFVRNVDVSISDGEAVATAELMLSLTTKRDQVTFNVETKSDYRLKRTEGGWQVTEHSVRVLRGRTLSRHGPLNFARLINHSKEMRPAMLPAAA